jgi:hypothetical protein
VLFSGIDGFGTELGTGGEENDGLIGLGTAVVVDDEYALGVEENVVEACFFDFDASGTRLVTIPWWWRDTKVRADRTGACV